MIKSFLFGLTLLIFSGCTSMFFYPDKVTYRTPEFYDLKYKDIYFNSSNNTKLHAWHLYPDSESKGLVFVAHGNAQNISSHFASWVWLVKEGYEVFIFDYRGYGKSDSDAQLKGSIEDTTAALSYIENEYQKPYFVCGQSLGGTLLLNALKAHNTKNIKAVIIDSTFTGFADIANEKMDNTWILWPFQWIPYLSISSKYDSKDIVYNIDKPILFIHGSLDATIPPNNSWQLFEAASTPKELWLVKSAKHIQSFENTNVQKDFLEFLSQDTKHFSPKYSRMRIYEDNI